MYIIIVGLGSVGLRLAQDLSLSKDNVVVIDKNREALVKLGNRFNGRTIIGDALDVSVLQEAGMKACDAVFVLTGNENLNLVIAQVAQKIFKVKKVVVQMHSFSKEELYKKQDLIIINRTNLFLDKFKDCIRK